MPFYLLIGTLITVSAMWSAQKFFPEFYVELGLFLPLTAVSSLIALHCERFALTADIKETMIHACGTSAGYFAVTLITGIVREILSQASVFGAQNTFVFILPILKIISSVLSFRYPIPDNRVTFGYSTSLTNRTLYA